MRSACRFLDLAAASVLAALSGAEQSALDHHLAQGCDECLREIRALREIAAGMAETAAAPPPPNLRERLLTAAARSRQSPGILLGADGLLIARSEELEWMRVSEGIDAKPVWTDPEKDIGTLLVRFAPGARYAATRHSRLPHLFVLSGDLRVGEMVMQQGDSCYADADELCGRTFSQGGCELVLLEAPLSEWLPAAAEEDSWEGIAAALALAVEQDAPASLRERVLSQAASTARSMEPAGIPGGFQITRGEELEWRPFTPGIEIGLLRIDTDRSYRSFLLRFAPGAKLYKHWHGHAEDVFVVGGDIWVHGQRMTAGDYCRADAESIHEESYTESGCVLLVNASMDTQPIA